MPDKFIRHGATFCGDGTSPDLATSNGGVGAWNNINILEGTAPPYGTLAAGDVVYIRSRDETGANITRTLSASVTLGSTAATLTSPITWVLDDGRVWSSVDGTLTYNCPSTFVVLLRNYNKYISAKQKSWVIVEQNPSTSFKEYVGSVNTVTINGLYFDASIGAGSNGNKFGSYSGNSFLENVTFKCGTLAEFLIAASSYSVLTISGIDVELTRPVTSPLFRSGGAGASLFVFGGKVRGNYATTGAVLTQLSAQGVVMRIFGLEYPNTMSVASSLPGFAESEVSVTGSDSLVGAQIVKMWGRADSRTDSYFPTLNATLPDSFTKWSWWLYPVNASESAKMHLPICKVYTDNPSSKTITLELLIANSFSAVKKNTLWMTVTYFDAVSGANVSLTTFDPRSIDLDSSSASWSATTYGATSYVKRKLSVQTPTAIKKDSLITVVLNGIAKSASANDTIIVCPDFVLS